jgi:signal transduction histidine kinase
MTVQVDEQAPSVSNEQEQIPSDNMLDFEHAHTEMRHTPNKEITKTLLSLVSKHVNDNTYHPSAIEVLENILPFIEDDNMSTLIDNIILKANKGSPDPKVISLAAQAYFNFRVRKQ